MSLRGRIQAVYNHLTRFLGAAGCSGACDHPADGGITGDLDASEWVNGDTDGR